MSFLAVKRWREKNVLDMVSVQKNITSNIAVNFQPASILLLVTGRCLAGEYSDETTGNCEKCPKNEYQDLPMKSFCMPCPDGMVTAGNGTATKSECECPPYYTVEVTTVRYLTR